MGRKQLNRNNMKYFIDCEFLEGKQDKRLFGIKIGETKPTIDLISIGIVSSDGREYYAVSKDFNLYEAWNRYDLVPQSGDVRNIFPEGRKVYWIRRNVLEVIFNDMVSLEFDRTGITHHQFTYSDFKELLSVHGKTNKQIAEDIKEFTIQKYSTTSGYGTVIGVHPIEFYGYYSDYDWVCFCWLFGRMIDLPKDFPIYCIDLKQELDRKVNNLIDMRKSSFNEKLNLIKQLPNYPKQTVEHSSLHDARFNRDLYNFLKTL